MGKFIEPVAKCFGFNIREMILFFLIIILIFFNYLSLKKIYIFFYFLLGFKLEHNNAYVQL